MKSHAQTIADFLVARAGGATGAEVAVMPEPWRSDTFRAMRALNAAGYTYTTRALVINGWPAHASVITALLSLAKKRHVVVFDTRTSHYDDRAIVVATNESPDKILRKMAAAVAVEERLQEETNQFQAWTRQPPRLGIPGETLLSGLVDAGIKYGGFVLTGIESRETIVALIRDRVYPMDDIQRILADDAFSYEASISPLMKDKSRPVVVLGMALGASMFVAVSTWDSPDKVARKLMAALSVRESKLTEGWQAMPRRLTRGEHAQESMINEDRGEPLVISQKFPEESPMYRVVEKMERHGTKVNGIISNFWGSEAYNTALRAGYNANWSLTLQNSDGVLDIDGRLVEQCVLVLGSLVTSSIAVCVHTDDSPEKVLRKLEAARFNTESLARNLIREATT